MKNIFTSNSAQARLAAGLFFLVCWPTARIGSGYSHSNFLVSKDVVATANNMLSDEFVFRAAVVSHLVSVIAFTFMALVFYRLFSPADKHLSRIMIVPSFLQLFMVFMLEVFCFTAFMVLKGDITIMADEALKQDLVYVSLRMHTYGSRIFQMFLGLWVISLGLLIYRSGFAPKVIAILAIIGGAGFIVESCAFVLLQRPVYLTVISFLKFVFIPAFSPMLWFLVKGVRTVAA